MKKYLTTIYRGLKTSSIVYNWLKNYENKADGHTNGKLIQQRSRVMYIKTGPKNIEGSSRNLLFHQDPDIRLDAAIQLGGDTAGVSDQRLALEALTTALQDPCSTVQEAVLQSLMRMSVKNG